MVLASTTVTRSTAASTCTSTRLKPAFALNPGLLNSLPSWRRHCRKIGMDMAAVGERIVDGPTIKKVQPVSFGTFDARAGRLDHSLAVLRRVAGSSGYGTLPA